VTHQTCSTLNLTVFPQSPGMAATFNTTLEMLKGDVIGRELRAIALAQLPDFNRFLGLSCFSPMINVIRDPMWGRNSEAYSECPYLTGQFAHAVIRGMAGNAQRVGGHAPPAPPAPPPRFIQAFGGCKHYVPYDGAALTHASDFDLFSTYLPGFARCIEGGALNLMCSYPTPMTAGAKLGAGSRCGVRCVLLGGRFG
jgi:beta-glucosidase